MTTHRWTGLVVVIVVLLGLGPAAAVVGQTPPFDASAAPVVVGCDQAGARLELTASARLDPSCTYAGFDITASDVTLDCAGATVAGPVTSGERGIEIRTPVAVELHDVTVRNCRVEGFTNSIRVTRTGFRTLADGVEFEHPTSAISIVDNVFTGSRGVGAYVDGYVSGVTLAGNEIRGAGSSGVYLETGSKGTVVTDNLIVDNGFRENGPGGQQFRFGGTDIWFWGVGREGVSIDGSYDNVIRDNTFRGNSAGGVFLYKNCGEYPTSDRYFERRDHADGNAITGNTFEGGRNGVWIGSRMGENTLPMDCADPAYVSSSFERIVLDHAERNRVEGNAFHDVTYGVRVEDDHNTVRGNTFTGATPDRHAVVIGTPQRTTVLGLPVTDTVLTDNVSTIVGNADPYRWVHGLADTEVRGNLALGRPTGLCEGVAIPRQFLIFVIAIEFPLPDGSKPPTPDLTVPEVGALPACPRDPDPEPTTTTTTSTAPASTTTSSSTPDPSSTTSITTVPTDPPTTTTSGPTVPTTVGRSTTSAPATTSTTATPRPSSSTSTTTTSSTGAATASVPSPMTTPPTDGPAVAPGATQVGPAGAALPVLGRPGYTG